MLYRKMQISQGQEKPAENFCGSSLTKTNERVRLVEKNLSDNSLTAEYDMPSHRPEIILPAEREMTKSSYRQKSAFPSGRILAVIALCAVSFAVGCSFTDDKVSETIIGISSAVLGKKVSVSEKQPDALSASTTHYEKYMPREEREDFYYGIISEGSVPIEELQSETVLVPSVKETEVGVMDVGVMDVGVTEVENASLDGEKILPVLAEDLSALDGGVLNNQTTKRPDTGYLLDKKPKAFENMQINPSEPLVLIVHTHGTESYNTCSADGFIGESTSSRSESLEENVVGIGADIAEILSDYGIPVIHSEKMCDKESFVNAYGTSADEVKMYLEMYPSIRFVIDLHRDAIESPDGLQKKPVFDFAGEKTAQLMFVVGTDEAGANHKNWEENLCLALNVQSEMSENYPGLFRSINLRTASFNQQLSPGYMLLECGAFGNTYAEAKRAAKLFATGFARMIVENAK